MERGFLTSASKTKNKDGGSKDKDGSFGPGLISTSTLLVDATSTIHIGTGSVNNSGNGRNGDGDSENAGQTCPNSTSDGVVVSPPISTPNPVKSSSYANVTGKPSRTKVNFRTLFTSTGNEIDVVVPVESIRAISKRFANTAYGFFLGNSMDGLDAMLENGSWFIRNNLLILKKWHPDVNLLKEDVGNVPVWVKLHGVPVTAFSEDGLSGRSSYARAMIELRADVELKDNIMECPKNIGAGETKNLKKPSQTPRGVLVGQKVGFKLAKQVFQPVSKKPSANTRTSNLASQKANSTVSSFWNVDFSSPSTTPIIKKIDKIEKLIIDGQATLVDNEGKPLEKVESSGDYDSEDEVASVDNEIVSFLARKDGYGTNSLLEQWKESYENGDYDYDPYDDDMYEGLEIPVKL
ncbi:putative reverse transcriptase domain-containing protein [Tanacetum coccineum]